MRPVGLRAMTVLKTPGRSVSALSQKPPGKRIVPGEMALTRKGVRVNAISPGTIRFPGGFWDKAETERPGVFKTVMARNPTGRMGAPEEIANVAAFVASPAASYIIGANLV